MSDPITFTTTTLAPGPADFVFDDIGFGPINGTLVLTEELLGIPLPLIDAGVTLGYSLGAQLVLSGGFGTPEVNINYAISDGTLVGQSSLVEIPTTDPQFLARLQTGAIYANRAITFDTGTIHHIDTGNAIQVTGSDAGAFLRLDLHYQLKLQLINAFVELGFPIYEDATYNFSAEDGKLLDLSGTFNFFDLAEGETLAEITNKSDPFFGTFLKVPITPKFENGNDYTVNALDNGLTSVSIYDTGDPFAQLKVDFAKMLAKAGVPIGFDLDLGFASGALNLISAVGYANAAMGQRETFRADDVHVRLELFDFDGVSTGKVVEGRLGDKLMFDAITLVNTAPEDFGFGSIKASYTLYGALEQETGLEFNAGINLGLLTGSVHVDIFGFEANGSFGPLIPLPSIDFSTGLIPLVTDSKAIVFDVITREYSLYSEKQPIASNDPDTPTLGPASDPSFDGLGGDDVITASNIVSHSLYGSEGNDTIYGSGLQTNAAATDASDLLSGGTGDDYLEAGEGSDQLYAGNGADTLIAGAGDDYLSTVGTDGADVLDGGTGFDKAFIDRQGSTINWAAPAPFSGFFNLGSVTGVNGVLPDGTIVKGIEQWQLMLGFGNDAVVGGQYDDVINGGAGADSLDGAGGFDIVRGEGGNDTLRWQQPVVQGWADQVSGGVGLDTVNIFVSETQDVAFNLSGQAAYLPNPSGGIGVWTDNSGSIDGVKLDGDSGNFLPLLIGNFGDFASTAHVSFLNTAATPDLALKVRTDVEKLTFLQTGSGRVFVTGGYLADVIISGDGADRLDGLLGADTIQAYGGDDFVVNWDDDTLLDGGEGVDTLAVIRSGATAKAMSLDFLATNAGGLGQTSDGALFTGFELLKFEGSSKADFVKGGLGADTLYGNNGNDILEGRGGGDMVDGGEGDDTIVASEGLATGSNAYVGGAGIDTLVLDWNVATISGGGFGGIGAVDTALNLNLASPDIWTLATGSTVSGFERVTLDSGDGNDVIVSGTGFIEKAGRKPGQTIKLGDVIDTGGGSDQVTARGLYDVISTGRGDDTVTMNMGGVHKLDGGEGYDTLIIKLPFSINAKQIKDNIQSFSYENEDGSRTVNVAQFTLPDGTVYSNFERVIFDVETLTDLARAAASKLDDVIGVGLGGRTDGGLGNDVVRLQLRVEAPVPDLLGPIARLRGGGGDDLLQINARAQIEGGEGFDRAEVSYGHLLENINGTFDSRGASLTGDNGKKLARVTGVEDTQVTLGAGNDHGAFEAGGNFEVDFGAGFDTAQIKNGADDLGKTYGFGGIAPTVQFLFTTEGEPGVGQAGRVIPTARAFSDGEGLLVSNFERLNLQAGAGDDVIDLSFAPETLAEVKADGGGGFDIIYGSMFSDTLLGGAGDDVIRGEGGNDRLEGGADNDEIDGGFGMDTLLGGAGNDDLTGGTDADSFIFDATLIGGYDTINDFNADEGDIIDLSLIDAVARARGNQAFTFIGEEPFGRAPAGQVHVVHSGGSILIEGDVTGDGIADFTIELVGVDELDPDSLIL